MPATFSVVVGGFYTDTVATQSNNSNKTKRRFIRISRKESTDYTDYNLCNLWMVLLIAPLRNSSRCPGRARCLQLFLQLRQIDFNQLAQLGQHTFKILRSSSVLIVLSLGRTGN